MESQPQVGPFTENKARAASKNDSEAVRLDCCDCARQTRGKLAIADHAAAEQTGDVVFDIGAGVFVEA